MARQASLSFSLLHGRIAQGNVSQAVQRQAHRQFRDSVIAVSAGVGNADPLLPAGIHVHVVDADEGHGYELQVLVRPDHFARQRVVGDHQHVSIVRSADQLLHVRGKAVVSGKAVSLLRELV